MALNLEQVWAKYNEAKTQQHEAIDDSRQAEEVDASGRALAERLIATIGIYWEDDPADESVCYEYQSVSKLVALGTATPDSDGRDNLFARVYTTREIVYETVEEKGFFFKHEKRISKPADHTGRFGAIYYAGFENGTGLLHFASTDGFDGSALEIAQQRLAALGQIEAALAGQ